MISEFTEQGALAIQIESADDSTPTKYVIDLARHHTPATRPTDLVKRWESWRLGAFLCFNTNQFSGSEHCHTGDAKLYDPPELDVAGWVRALKAGGMRYAVLTTRHTSGFLLWDSATTTFDVASSGNKTDLVKAFADECDKQGVAPGLYYCMWGGEKYRPTANARAIILAQLYELATRYGKVPYFWVDMMNWAPKDLPAQQVYDAIKNLQPDTIVIMNQHVQDGREIKYFPTDVLNGEILVPPAEGHKPFRKVGETTYYLPFEFCLCSQRREGGIKYDPVGPSCWFTYGKGRSFAPSEPFPAQVVAERIKLAWQRGAVNVLLATAPDHTGEMRPADVEQLISIGKLLAGQLKP
ncbi:MAG: alpha-L-fucosidase [Phycisphaerae bacterium]|nr:alpha-L-fucosidase [Phycisphaerae bacterium]